MGTNHIARFVVHLVMLIIEALNEAVPRNSVKMNGVVLDGRVIGAIRPTMSRRPRI